MNKLSIYRSYSISFSLIFLIGLFGFSALKILALVSIHYSACHALSGRKAVLFAWAYSIGVLFLSWKFDGYRFHNISRFLSWMDNINGTGIRWHIIYNFNILRTISFTTDKYYAEVSSRQTIEGGKMFPASNQSKWSASERVKTPHPLEDYNYLNFLCYVLYAPFYLAGPVVTFNDFLHQTVQKSDANRAKSSIIYLGRWIFAFLVMEVMMHLFYVVSIKNMNAWQDYSPMELFLFGFVNLKMIWLKLMVIWRFFRCWGMLEGIESIENMGRCMSNHYSGVDFWRTWHTSFNKWYTPLT